MTTVWKNWTLCLAIGLTPPPFALSNFQTTYHHCGYRRYLYHQGTKHTTRVRAAWPWLINKYAHSAIPFDTPALHFYLWLVFLWFCIDFFMILGMTWDFWALWGWFITLGFGVEMIHPPGRVVLHHPGAPWCTILGNNKQEQAKG